MAHYIDSSKCVCCGSCKDICPADVISKGTPFVIDADRCVDCGSCVPQCPVEAISVRLAAQKMLQPFSDGSGDDQPTEEQDYGAWREKQYEVTLGDAKVTPEKVADIDIEKIPSAVAACFNGLKDLKKEVDAAIDAANRAKNAAISASETKAHRIRFWKNKDSISELQNAMVELSEANAGQPVLIQKLAEYIEKISKAMGYLFGLGLLGLAQNRTVVQRVKMELEHASEEELDQLARNELQNCLNQLKAMEDMQVKFGRLAETQKSMGERVASNTAQGERRDKEIGQAQEDIKVNQAGIKENREKGIARDHRIEKLSLQMKAVNKGRGWFWLFGILSVAAFVMAVAVFVKTFFMN